MIVKIKKSKNVLKIKYISNKIKCCEKIIDNKEFDIDENSYFTIIKYILILIQKIKLYYIVWKWFF